MQEVYKNGTAGKIGDFDVEELQKYLQKLNVDYVRIFNGEFGLGGKK